MKKVSLILIFTVFAMLVTNAVFAQGAKNRAGVFLAADFGDIDQIGIGGVAEFKVATRFTLSPQLILYFPEDDFHALEINFNGNYYFYNHDVFSFYGLGGLNFARVAYRGPGPDGHDSEVGLNLGGGINFEIGKTFAPFSEIRLTIGDYDQLVLTAGLKFNLH